jgi:hypothetical protein
MLLRVIAAVALIAPLNSGAFAGSQPGVVQRMSCSVVRHYVAKYSAATAEMWARGHGATEAQIDAARRCLRDQPVPVAQRE